MIVELAMTIALIGLSAGLMMTAYRALTGPTVADRVIALDAASVMLIGLLVVGSMKLRETAYLDYVLVLAVLSYVSTVAFAKYIERGVIIERDPVERDSD